MPRFKCNKCELVWDSYISEPRACPKCHRYDWKEPRKRPFRKMKPLADFDENKLNIGDDKICNNKKSNSLKEKT